MRFSIARSSTSGTPTGPQINHAVVRQRCALSSVRRVRPRGARPQRKRSGIADAAAAGCSSISRERLTPIARSPGMPVALKELPPSAGIRSSRRQSAPADRPTSAFQRAACRRNPRRLARRRRFAERYRRFPVVQSLTVSPACCGPRAGPRARWHRFPLPTPSTRHTPNNCPTRGAKPIATRGRSDTSQLAVHTSPWLAKPGAQLTIHDRQRRELRRRSSLRYRGRPARSAMATSSVA